jgi:hypothetical protein
VSSLPVIYRLSGPSHVELQITQPFSEAKLVVRDRETPANQYAKKNAALGLARAIF